MGGDEQYRACAECAKKCSKVHGRRSPPSHLSFFKIMLGRFKEYLIVPPKFACLLGNLVGQNIYLENLNGHHWGVKLVKVDDHLAFQQGWNEFVSYHSIQVGEMLVFKYTSTSSFVVEIFGTSGCERSLFHESIDSDMHKGCPTDCSCFCKDGRKNDACRAHSCIGDRVPSKKNKSSNRTAPCETFSSPHLCCKTDGDFRKRTRSATECLWPHNDGRKHDKSAVQCCTKDEDSSRKRNAIRTTSCEIPFDPKGAAKDMWGYSNIQQTSSTQNVDNISGLQTATAVDYSEAPCIAVSEEPDRGQEESQMALSDICAKNVSPVINDAEKRQERSQMAPSGVCANMSMHKLDPPELPCKLSKIDFQNEKEMIDTLASEFISTKIDTENRDISMIIEEKSFHCTNSKLPQSSCGKNLKGNKNEHPSAKYLSNISHCLPEIDICLTNCLEVPPISSEMYRSKELGCKTSVVELPISGSSNDKVVHKEDESAAAKDRTSSLKCSVDVGKNRSAYDMATYRFLLDEKGTCYIVQNSFGNPESNSTSANLPNNDMDNAKCNVMVAPTAKQDNVPKDLFSTSIVGSRNEGCSSQTAVIGTSNNGYHARNGHLDTMESNAAATLEGNDTLSVRDALQHMSKVHKSQEGSVTMSGSREHGVEQDASLQKNGKLKPYLKEPVLKTVKAEIMDPDDLPLPNSTYFSFSLIVNSLSWHELSEPLPSNCGKWRLERKVVLLRDPAMRVWPVLYHESFRFTGFLGGWEAFVTANIVRKGDTCHFEAASHMEPVFQVRISRAPDA